MKRIISFLVCTYLCSLPIVAQVYTDKQTRHRFAQLNVGIDVQSSFGGVTSFLDAQGVKQSLNLNSSISPRILIGGTHFWGHADFYIAIPVGAPTFKKYNQEVTFFRGVETVFKYYPWRIEQRKLRPYIGASLAPYYFRQHNYQFTFPTGPERYHTSFPVLGGFTYNAKNHLFDLGVSWNYNNQQDYYISRTQIASITTPPIYASLSYRYMIETTISAEKGWESGRTQKVTDALAAQGRLNGFYLGAGMSSAFWLKESSYNKHVRPYMGNYGISLMPDFTLGYYLHNPDLNIAIGYRGYGAVSSAYGARQVLRRKSVVLEATKYLFDYHGFVPFVGPALSAEKLSFKEDFEGNNVSNVSDTQLGYGLTFGWDIRPNRIQSWILRTNLRWYPNLSLEVAPGREISFENLEFNFIQLIIYPNRMISKKDK